MVTVEFKVVVEVELVETLFEGSIGDVEDELSMVLLDKKLGGDKVDVDVFRDVDWWADRILGVLTLACTSSRTEQEMNLGRLVSS